MDESIEHFTITLRHAIGGVEQVTTRSCQSAYSKDPRQKDAKAGALIAIAVEDHFVRFGSPSRVLSIAMAVVNDTEKLQADEMLSKPLRELGLAARAHNALTKHLGIKTVGELCDKTTDELKAVPALGRTSLRHIRRTLDEFGLSLKDDTDPQ